MSERSFKKELLAPWTARDTAIAAIVGALYTVITMLIAPIAYGPLQIRLSEALTVLPFDKKYGGRPAAVGALVGVAIVTFGEPYAGIATWWGPISGVTGLLFVWWAGIYFKGSDFGKIVACIFGVVNCVFFVGYLMLHLSFGVPLWAAIGGVALGEVVSLAILGFILLKALERTHTR